ncbi:bifunctional DNA primase/polymerase [Actinacidiphila sp. ITFR-21]|uniref:bifunctional DNA primase/polymerase n=1 Tax=Actinacidiphila sp. ITFR-21 TaxID=3075199 RepID=UPI002889C021|nr:bifunctional DNA primase/polymerase [Streptomyces sp. ITFR-21]WNI19681.1 bifunctional DNA primase/polymerase [Streptomyces sp. ITFR-21]
MREILGRRRKLSLQRKGRSGLLHAVLTYAEQWKWRVVPGVGYDRHSTGRVGGERACACPRVDCPVPGVHPLDPGLLAATHDARMVRWWWTGRPQAPVILATGDRVSAASLPAAAGELALAAIEKTGFRLGPVIATPSRYFFLVAPYSLAELGELLNSQDWVPTSLRYHGDGGYVPLPATDGGGADTAAPGEPGWVREPAAGADDPAPWLPRISTLVEALVRAGRTAPDGDRLTF